MHRPPFKPRHPGVLTRSARQIVASPTSKTKKRDTKSGITTIHSFCASLLTKILKFSALKTRAYFHFRRSAILIRPLASDRAHGAENPA